MKKLTDSEIRQTVLRGLKWDPRIDETNIGVEVSGGVVTLSGTVTNQGKRQAAQRCAHRVGVRDVVNELVVKPLDASRRTDLELTQAVQDALEWDAFVSGDCLRVTVSDGWVTLEGQVDHVSERADAEHAVRALEGIRGLTSRIELRPPVAAPTRLYRSIRNVNQLLYRELLAG